MGKIEEMEKEINTLNKEIRDLTLDLQARIQRERMKMNEPITLILDRDQGDLWLDFGGIRKFVLWNVTELELDENSFFNHVKILRKGKQIGGAWGVKEIKERW